MKFIHRLKTAFVVAFVAYIVAMGFVVHPAYAIGGILLLAGTIRTQRLAMNADMHQSISEIRTMAEELVAATAVEVAQARAEAQRTTT